MHTNMPSATPLHPKYRAVIVGACGGLGSALSRRLARAGWTLALLSRQQDCPAELCAELNADGVTRALAYEHDVTHYAEVPALLKRIIADLGGLDLLIYNAGVNFPPGLETLNAATDIKMVEVNTLGAIAWLAPAADLFKQAKGGMIVGISSVAGDRGRIANPGYNASKAGLTTYLEGLRNRFTRHGVHVLTVIPGFMQTEMLKAAAGATPFTISAERAADDIYKAIRKRKQVIYTHSIWHWIMLVIKHIPSVVFRRLNF
ncbi:MAG: SDR family NAD(P)-dependent oxidoreductase [Chloroflexota bacterium]